MEFWNVELSLVLKVILISFGLATLLLILYYGFIHLRIGLYRKKTQITDKKEPVSIVVCVKDDYDLLKEKLFYLLEQEYPLYEVIIVNRASQDETEYLLKVFQETYPHLKIVNLQNNVNYFKGKKFPLSIGIKSAKYDIILLTDADCLPQNYHWIENMSENFTEGTQIVLGYNAIESRPTLMNLLLQYDNASKAAFCFGFALFKKPYIGFGKNLAYRKSFFFENEGFIKHYRLPMGDDSLFVNKNATKSNTNICLNKDSFTISLPQTRFFSWIQEKRQEARVTREFSFANNLSLFFYPFSVLVFHAALIALLVLNFQLLWKICFGILAFKLIAQIFSFFKLSKNLNTPQKAAFFAPVLELFFLIFNFVIYLTALKNDKRWK